MPTPVLRAPLLGIALLLSAGWWGAGQPAGRLLAQGLPVPAPSQAVPLPIGGAMKGPMPGSMPLPATGMPAQASSALLEERTRAAAVRILRALQTRDGAAGYRLFAPDLQRMTSVAMVQQRLQSLPRLLSWTLGPVIPGQDFSTITASLRTAAGPRQLEMMIDGAGLLEGYHFDVTDQPAEAVARQFLAQLSQGRYVSAASFLSPEMQTEIPPSVLQLKWQRLQRSTGDFVAIRRVFRSERSADQKLVLIKTEFRRITDTLFVILDDRNQIIGVDFPTDAATGGNGSVPGR